MELNPDLEGEMAQSVAAVIVLAAGAGTRMKSSTSKLLHTLCGRSLLSWALDAAQGLDPERLIVVVGHERDQVEAHLDDIAPTALRAVQEKPLGTGDAVRAAMAALGDIHGEVVVTYGDVPLLTTDILTKLVASHRDSENAVTVMTAIVDNPKGYGRILRDGVEIIGIREDKDATTEERQIDEINSGIYVFDADLLAEGLTHLTPANAQGELYLTDIVGYARSKESRVGAYVEADHWATEGVNDRVQLATLSGVLNARIVENHMREGVTVIDPNTTWIEAGVSIAPDTQIWPGTILRGATSIATGAVIGPDTRLTDCEVGERATVLRSEATLATIGDDANVGPFSYLRPGTLLGTKGKIGAFVETKNAQIGAGSKVPHLTYCGDAVLGEGVNIGAGTIFANYDGTNKRTSTVGDRAFVGSDSILVAPVHIGADAFIAAGSAIIEDVEAEALGVARGRQRVIPGWVESFRQRDSAETIQSETKE